MRYSSVNRGLPGGNPIANALVVIVGVLAIAASLVLGFVAFVVLGSIVLVLGAIIALRVWWFNRKLGKQVGNAQTAQEGGVIEGEYHVVKRDEKP
jgi:protein-S-isoprenylcysteine O-methyltransferase Ste14